jgi:hypothetical protein
MPALVDDLGPSSPHNVAYSGDTNAVTLTWSAATDDDAVDHYDVERDAAIIGTPGLSFRDTRVGNLMVPAYRAIAIDRSGTAGRRRPCRSSCTTQRPRAIVALALGDRRAVGAASGGSAGVDRRSDGHGSAYSPRPYQANATMPSQTITGSHARLASCLAFVSMVE